MEHDPIEDLFAAQPPPGIRTGLPTYGPTRDIYTTHGAKIEALFAQEEPRKAKQAKKEARPFRRALQTTALMNPITGPLAAGAMALGLWEPEGPLAETAAELPGIGYRTLSELGPEMARRGVVEGERLGPLAAIPAAATAIPSFITSGGRPRPQDKSSLAEMIEAGLTDVSNLNPEAVRARELGITPMGGFSPGAAKAVGLAGEALTDPIGIGMGSATMGSLRALQAMQKGTAGAQALKAAVEVLEQAKHAGPGFAIANAKKLEDAERMVAQRLRYGAAPPAPDLGKALLDPSMPGAGTLADVDERILKEAAGARQREAERIRGAMEADEEALAGHVQKAREEAAATTKPQAEIDAELKRYAASVQRERENVAAEAAMVRERRPVVEGIEEQPVGTPPVRDPLMEPVWVRKGPEPGVEPPPPQGTYQEARREAVGTPPAREMDLGDFDVPTVREPPPSPGGAVQPPAAPQARLVEEAVAEAGGRPQAAPRAPSGVADDIFEPTLAPKGETQQFDVGEFAPAPKGMDDVRRALLEEGWSERQIAAMPDPAAVASGEDFGYALANAPEHAPTTVPRRPGGGEAPGGKPPWTMRGIPEWAAEGRYYRTAGQAAPHPTAGKPGKPPTMGRQAALREAGQAAGLYQRAPYAGELPSNVLGEFKKDSETIVNRWLDDPETGAHEMGHAFDKMFMSPGAAKLGTGVDLAKQGQFLDALGAGKGGAPRAEGWAEAMRLYVNDPEALAKMPGGVAFRDWLSSTLRAKNPKMAKVVETLRDRLEALKGATPGQRVDLWIKEVNERNLGGGPAPFTPLSMGVRAKTATLDYTAPAEAFTAQLRQQGAGQVKLESGRTILAPEDDLGLYAREMRNQGATFQTYYRNGPPGSGVPGLRGIIEKGGDDLDKYVTAKHVLANPQGMNQADYADFRKTAQEIETNPEKAHVIEAWRDLGRWNEAIHKRRLEAGLIDRDTYRKLADDARRGAPLELEDVKEQGPIATQTQAAMAMLREAELNEVAQTLDRVVGKYEGTGKWLERAPAGAEVPNGRVAVPVYRDGKTMANLHVDKDLWRSFVGLDPRVTNTGIKWAEKVAGFFSKAVTGHLAFAVPAFIRAVQNSILTSRAQTNPLQAFFNAWSGARKVLKDTDIAKQALADKAFLTGWASVGAQDTATEIAKLNRKGWWQDIKRTMSKYVGPEASMTAEKMARMGEYEAVLAKYAKEGLSDKSARRLAADAARALDVDMLTRGANDSMRFVAAVTPFLNPALQGWSNDLVNLHRLFKTDKVQAAIRLGTFASLTMLAHYLSRNDKRMKNISADQHARWEHVSFSEDMPIIALPRPQGIAGVFTGMVRLILDNLDRKNPELTTDLLAPLEQGLPPIPIWMNPAMRAAVELGMGMKSDRWREPVVPLSRKRDEGMEGILNPIQRQRLANIAAGTYGGKLVEGVQEFTGFGVDQPERGPLEWVPGVTHGDTSMPRPLQHFYAELKPLARLDETAGRLRKTDPERWREFVTEHKDELKRLKRMEFWDKKLDKLRERRNATKDRAARNAINQQMSELAEEANSEAR